MRCIAVDDEPLALEGMKLNIAEVPDLELLGTFPNALKANAFLQEQEVDLMFLDINMPGLSGLDFIRSLRNPPLVILTTAYHDFALEGFELDVLDYLVKPIRMSRFLKAVNKALELHRLKEAAAGAEQGEAKDSEKDGNPPIQSNTKDGDSIFIRADRKYIRVALSDIRYISGLKDYVVLHTRKGKYTTALNLRTIHSQLPQNRFARISKSHLVNVAYVDAFDGMFVYLGEENLQLGKAFAKDFKTNYVDKDLIARK